MKYFDIRKTPKQRPHQSYHGNAGFAHPEPQKAPVLKVDNKEKHSVQESANEIIPAAVLSTSIVAEVPAIDPDLLAAAEKLKLQYELADKQLNKDRSKNRIKSPFVFKKVYALFAFTFLILGFGIFLGARFVSFANSVSTSKTSFYKSVANGIGSVLGPYIPVLQQLDNTKVAEAIRNKEKINILLLGYGGEGHSGSYLTDTLMLLNIDFATDKVTFIPVPRDTWVKIPTRGYDGSYAKINAAYTFGIDQSHYPNKLPQFTGENGGGNLAKYEISQVTGITPDYYVSIDFAGFKKIVDALGGITINVENSFTDYSYPSGDQNVNAPSCSAEDIPDSMITDCRYKKLHFDKGEQVMDGSRALEYVRSRHAAGVEGSDFSRSKRQQNLISAIEKKATSLGAITKIFDVMDSVQGHFRTDLALAEIRDLSKYVDQNDSQNMQSIIISESRLLVASRSADGQWILIPAKEQTPQGEFDFSAVRKYVADQLAAFEKQDDNTDIAK